MNGILGTWDLLANVKQAIYYNSYETSSVVIANLCNKGGGVAYVSIAVSSSATNIDDKEWIVWRQGVDPKTTFERMSIMVGVGKYLVVRSTSADVNAICYGVTNGSVAPTGISVNLGTAPAWSTSSTLSTIYAGDAATSIQLTATDEEGEAVTYSVSSGSLPTGLSLSSAGLITGTPSNVGFVSGMPDSSLSFGVSATDSRGNATPQTFNITKRWLDGSSSILAAPNASIIRALTGSTTSGVYWINIPTIGATQLYCDQSTDGGGWMMLGYAGSTSGVGDINHIMFYQFGSIATTRANNQTSFSRFDYAKKFTNASANSQVMWRRTTDTNVILIHSMDEMWNRIPGGTKANDMNMNGTDGSPSGFPINTMKMSNSGPGGIVTRTSRSGRYESGPSYPGIAWNSNYNENSDGTGSFTTALNRRSLIYWETNGPQSQNQWFHADPLQMGPSRGATNGTTKKDIEVYFKV